ncbi:DUF4118 domain-containing protein [Dermatophilaceae bacterium Soc4.6]
MDRLQTRPDRRPWLLLLAAVTPLVVAGLLSLVRDQVSAAGAVLVLVLVVVGAASTGDRMGGLLAAASAGLFFDTFLTRPYGTLAISNRDDVEAFVLLVLVGVAVTEVALWGRRQQARASRIHGYLDGALAAAEVVAGSVASDGSGGTSGPDALVRVVTGELTDLLRLDDCRWEPGVAVARRTTVEPDGSVLRAGRPFDVARHGLPTDDETALPVRVGGVVTGTLLLVTATRVRRPAPEELRVAVLLADQLGRARVGAGPAR